MRSSRWIVSVFFCILAIVLFFHLVSKPTQRVLVFSKTQESRHEAIEYAIDLFPTFLSPSQWELTFTEDAASFDSNLTQNYDSVLFLLTSGDILDSEQEKYLQEFVEGGGGFVGIHSAADTEHDWEWYQQLVGARYVDHTPVSSGTFTVLDTDHPAMSHLPRKVEAIDEWYEFERNPRGDVHVLATVNQGAVFDAVEYGTSDMMDAMSGNVPKIQDRPITWCHTNLGGRSFYIGHGHTKEAYEDQRFQDLIKNALLWASGVLAGDCSGGIEANYRREVLVSGIEAGMEFDVSSTGDIYFIERFGTVNVYRVKEKKRQQLGYLDVFKMDGYSEFGLLGLALDPNYESNSWIYLYYSHSSEPYEILSRLTVNNWKLDKASEVILLEIPSERNVCCHMAGSIEFDTDGNLYLATGDYTNIDRSDGYAPQDEGIENRILDARRTAGNTNDLRGKILRITPQTDGSYKIPAGNLFSQSDTTRPEIYVMGVRNPFRISIDKRDNSLYWGDIGPDAWMSSTRGPEGFDEINYASEAGNYGWPFCIANNKPYKKPSSVDTGNSREWYTCARPINFSHWNTGEKELPSAREPFLWYSYFSSPIFINIRGEGSRAAMAGPIYQFEDHGGFPRYYDGDLFIFDWARSAIKVVKTDTAHSPSGTSSRYADYVRMYSDLLTAYNESTGNQTMQSWGKLHYESYGKKENRLLPSSSKTTEFVLSISPFLPKEKFYRPIDMTFDKSGNLYVLEYGETFDGSNGRISKVTYSKSL